SDEYADGWRMVALNADKHEATAAEWGVQSLPTLVLLRGGEELHRFAGAVVPSQIAASLDELSGAT
ncbi:MAG: thioredoxin family protein, partial [Gaiellaceae bacterium]